MRELHRLYGGKRSNDEEAINRLKQEIESGKVGFGDDSCMFDDENA